MDRGHTPPHGVQLVACRRCERRMAVGADAKRDAPCPWCYAEDRVLSVMSPVGRRPPLYRTHGH